MDTATYEIVKQYAQQVHEQYKPKAIYLYGSHVKGTAAKHSDIDVAVIFSSIDINKRMDILSVLLSIAAKHEADIEPNVLVDDGDYSKYSFLAEVMETGQLIEI